MDKQVFCKIKSQKLRYNLYYSFKSRQQWNKSQFVEHVQKLIDCKNSICILGDAYNDEEKQNIENFKNIIYNLVQFTYQEKFVLIDQVFNDVGWSCVIKSGQMLLFNIIFLKIFDSDQTKFEPLKNIFEDQYAYENATFSIQNFLLRGNRKNQKIGEQWSQELFFQILKNILEEQDFFIFQQKKNQKQYLYQKNKIAQQKRLYIEITSGLIESEKLTEHIEKYGNLLLVISLNLGIKKIENEYQNYLKSICSIKNFSGIIAAEKNSAYYIFGIQENNYLYLDPHVVNQKSLQTSCNIYQLDGNKIHPQVYITYLFKNTCDFKEFLNYLDKQMNQDVIFKKEEDDFESSLSVLNLQKQNVQKNLIRQNKKNAQNSFFLFSNFYNEINDIN